MPKKKLIPLFVLFKKIIQISSIRPILNQKNNNNLNIFVGYPVISSSTNPIYNEITIQFSKSKPTI